MAIPTLGFAIWVLAEAGGQTKIDPATLALARQNSGGNITALTGTGHTVYHSNEPLPEPKAPRDDGQPTLVWFTSESCTVCEEMLFVHTTMEEYQGRVVFVEKSVARETSDERLGVSTVPTFVMLDAEGNEQARFEAAATAEEFKAKVESAISAPTN